MTRQITTLVILITLALGLVGCGSSSASLLGTWQGQVPFDGVPFTDRMTFAGDEMGGAFTGRGTGVDPVDGCTYSFNYMGTWNLSSDDALEMEYTFASEGATGCTDPSGDYPETAVDAAELASLNAGLGGSYELTETTLAVRVNGTSTVYTRQ